MKKEFDKLIGKPNWYIVVNHGYRTKAYEDIKQFISKIQKQDRDKYISILKKYKCGKHKKLIKALNNPKEL